MKMKLLLSMCLCLSLASCSEGSSLGKSLQLNWAAEHNTRVGYGAQLLQDTFIGAAYNPSKALIFDLESKSMVSSVSGFAQMNDRVFERGNNYYLFGESNIAVTDKKGIILKTTSTLEYGNNSVFGVPVLFDDKVIVNNSHYLNIYLLADLLKDGAKPIVSRYFKSTPNGGIDDFSFDAQKQIIYLSNASEELGEENSTRLYALDLTGKTLWSKRLSVQTPAMDFAPRGIVEAFSDGVLVETEGRIHVFDAQGNATLANPAPFACSGTAILAEKSSRVVNGILYASPAGDHCIFALDLKTGKKKWDFQAPVGGTFSNKPLYLNGVVYAANPYVYAIDAETGQLIARSETRDDNLYDKVGTVHYDSKRNQLLVWGAKIYSYKPVR
jgi:outer membrane protein assembly factor BamB